MPLGSGEPLVMVSAGGAMVKAKAEETMAPAVSVTWPVKMKRARQIGRARERAGAVQRKSFGQRAADDGPGIRGVCR